MTPTVQAVPSEAISRPPLREADACTLVIFGATGDLTRRKLLPALYDLQCLGGMSSRCEIIGVGRTQLSDQDFRDRMREALLESKDVTSASDPRWRDFEQRLHYITGDPNDPAFYARLGADLEARRQAGGNPNRLFYVATPASLARPIIEGLGAAGLSKSDAGWSRIVLEPSRWRRMAIAACEVVGLAVGLSLLYYIVTRPVSALLAGKHIAYVQPHFFLFPGQIILYLAATCIVCLFSSHKFVNLFGVMALVLFIAAYAIQASTMVSVWCFFAAILSLLVYVHLRYRRLGGFPPSPRPAVAGIG